MHLRLMQRSDIRSPPRQPSRHSLTLFLRHTVHTPQADYSLLTSSAEPDTFLPCASPHLFVFMKNTAQLLQLKKEKEEHLQFSLSTLIGTFSLFCFHLSERHPYFSLPAFCRFGSILHISPSEAVHCTDSPESVHSQDSSQILSVPRFPRLPV